MSWNDESELLNIDTKYLFSQISVVTINGKKELEYDGKIIDRYKILALACKQKSEKKAFDYLTLAGVLFHPLDDKSFNTLYGAVTLDITWQHTKDESYYQSLFKKNYEKIRNGKVIERKNNNRNIPDAWVEENGAHIPVEVKLYDFDKKALDQLSRYMNVYECEKGIAVARSLTVDLPDNVEFISFNELEKEEELEEERE